MLYCRGLKAVYLNYLTQNKEDCKCIYTKNYFTFKHTKNRQATYMYVTRLKWLRKPAALSVHMYIVCFKLDLYFYMHLQNVKIFTDYIIDKLNRLNSDRI